MLNPITKRTSSPASFSSFTMHIDLHNFIKQQPRHEIIAHHARVNTTSVQLQIDFAGHQFIRKSDMKAWDECKARNVVGLAFHVDWRAHHNEISSCKIERIEKWIIWTREMNGKRTMSRCIWFHFILVHFKWLNDLCKDISISKFNLKWYVTGYAFWVSKPCCKQWFRILLWIDRKSDAWPLSHTINQEVSTEALGLEIIFILG